MKQRSWFLLICFTIFVRSSISANILFMELLSAPSHHIWNEAIIGGLLNNGHNITLFGHELPKIKSINYTVLRVEDNQTGGSLSPDLVAKFTPSEQITLEWQYQLYLCELHLNSKEIKILKNYPTNAFDLILMDLGAGQCAYPLLDHFSKAAVIGVSPFALPPSIANIMGAKVPNYIPMYSTLYNSQMSLYEKTHNSLLQAWDLINQAYYKSLMFTKTKEHFGGDIRTFGELEKKVILLLTNNDPVFDFAQPFPPYIIPVGGLHIKPAKKLGEEFQTLLDNAKHGVIYFSMGTIVAEFTPALKEMFIDVFSQLKQTVLWKYKEEDMKVSSNVIVRKWFPQSDILAHKNVKLFISHCGGLSAQESIYHKVPVLGIPVIVDQHSNAAKIVSKGGGLHLKFSELNKKDLLKSIKALVDDDKYKQKMATLSNLFKDQLTSPLEKAIFWIEYILRHKEEYSGHLNPAGRHMPWYEDRILDIILLAIVILLGMMLFSFCKLLNNIYKYCTGKAKVSKRKIKDN